MGGRLEQLLIEQGMMPEIGEAGEGGSCYWIFL